MRVLVTGSSGHLGEGLMRMLPKLGYEPLGFDIKPGAFTHEVGSILDRVRVRKLMRDVEGVLHAATLHKPHVATHTKQDFIDVNVTGTLTLLEEAVAAGVSRFIFSSTTSAFGAALRPTPDKPAAWIDEDVTPVPRNIYGVTKTSAEALCTLFARTAGLHCLILRLSRFFPEADDDPDKRAAFPDENAKANEFLYRRVDLEDAVMAHHHAIERAHHIRTGTFIISATTPFTCVDLAALRRSPADIVSRYFPDFSAIYEQKGYSMFPDIERVYVNRRAREALDWAPQYDFSRVLSQMADGLPIGSALARDVGVKGYHEQVFADGPYPV